MKKLKWIVMALVLVLGMAAFAACKQDEPETPVFTVTYYDGTTVLKTEEVEEGGYATDWEPEAKEGMEFSDWYVDAGLNRVFDFEGEAITADKSLYAGYVAVGTDDTRTWAIVGSGQGDILSSSAWGTVITDVHALEKTEGENEFTITLDLYEDDQFQFATDTSWMNQRGFGYIPLADRTMTVDGQEVTPFTGGGGIGETADKQSNIIVDYPGNYTFTLTTYPDEDYYDDNVNNGQVSISNFDTITYEYNGPAAELADSYTEYYIKGANITQWADIYNPATQMTRVGTTYTLSVYLTAGDQVMFTSLVVDRETGESTVGTSYLRGTNLDEASQALFTDYSNNMTPAADGSYTFTYNASTQVLSVTFDGTAALAEYDYYLDGEFGASDSVCEWGSYPNTDGDYTYAFTEQPDGTYLLENVVLTEGNQIVVRGFEQGEAPTNGGQAVSYNYEYFSPLSSVTAAFEAADVTTSNYNIAVLTDGTYNITFDPYSKLITIEDANAQTVVYLNGTINDWSHSFSETYRFTLNEETGNYEFTYTFAEGDQFGLVVNPTEAAPSQTWVGVGAMGTSGDANATFAGASNFTCSVAGTYRVVYNADAGTVDIYAVTSA